MEDIQVGSLACDGSPISKPRQVAGDAGNVSSPATTQPLPARRRTLKQHNTDDMLYNSPAWRRQLSASLQASTPATLTADFTVPAPADPVQRAQLAESVSKNSPEILQPSLSKFFGRPVQVQPAVPSLPPPKPKAEVPAPKAPASSPRPAQKPPAAASPAPTQNMTTKSPSVLAPDATTIEPSPAPQSSPVVIQPVTKTIPQEPPQKSTTWPRLPAIRTVQPTFPRWPPWRSPSLPAAAPSPSPAPPPAPSPSPSPALPQPTSMAEEATPVAVAIPAAPAPSPRPTPPSPTFSWPAAPNCDGSPNGQTATPDAEGRLWGWQDGHSCAFRTSHNRPVTISWDNALTCSGDATLSNSVYDSKNRLWGWQDGRSCAYRQAKSQASPDPHQAVITWDAAPTCSGTPDARSSVRNPQGQLWGWEGGKSCAFRIQNGKQAVSWVTAPACRNSPNQFTVVKDSLGRLWGWEDNRSCRFTPN